LLGRKFRLVAESVHAGPCLVARRSGVADRCVRLSVPETRIVAESDRVRRLHGRGLAGVQPAVCASVRVDMVQSKDEAMGSQARALNSLHYFLRGPLAHSLIVPLTQKSRPANSLNESVGGFAGSGGFAG